MSGETSAGRDPHLAAVRRGGLLSTTDHQRLVAWAADCAERVLPLFEAACPGDARPADALDYGFPASVLRSGTGKRNTFWPEAGVSS